MWTGHSVFLYLDGRVEFHDVIKLGFREWSAGSGDDADWPEKSRAFRDTKPGGHFRGYARRVRQAKSFAMAENFRITAAGLDPRAKANQL